MTTPEAIDPFQKKDYTTPTLTKHGDVEAITLGVELGENLDGAFTTSANNPRGTKQPRESVFS